jgi:hypothetical protein
MKRSVYFFFLGLGIFAVFAAHGNVARAFGISPPFLNAGHLVPGATYVQTVYILAQDQSLNADLPIQTTLTIPEPAHSWISIDKGFNFVIPKGTQQFPIQITVQVPKGASLGIYQGNLSIASAPSGTGQVTIALGTNIAINLTVGTDIYEKFSVPLITFPDIEDGWNPRVYVKFQNDGNVPEAFDGATYELIDQYGGTRLAYTQKNDGFPETKPFSTSEYTIEFPLDFHLGIGQYWANVAFYQHGKVVASQKTIFHVLEAGSITGVWGIIAHVLQNKAWITYGIIVLMIILLGTFWIYRRRRSR